VVLFIDEIHTLVGAGGNAGTGDAANLLKPALARGQLRTIGATTWSEYKRHIEKDPALTRRFQVLQVAEPPENVAVAMLRGLVPALEKHHGVWITDEAVQAAVTLSHRYIPARQLPDKAISLLDTACARIAVAQFTAPARLQTLIWQQETARTELQSLAKAHQFGRDASERIAELNTALQAWSEAGEALEKRWQAERECVGRIVSLRQQIAGALAQHECDTASLTARREALQKEEQQLAQLISDEQLVQAEVNEDVIARIVGDWTGIPVGQMLKDEVKKVMELPARLNQRVIGQPAALAQLSDCIMTARAGLADPRKPLGVFMLVGPSGVGKTETALAIAESMYGGDQNLITVNMSEYQEAHTISSLKGSPPGYVGYGEGGVLTEAVRRRPYSVVLLDEIEKAHPDVHELFYQVFDKGQLEDGEGRSIDFKNTVLLLTSNTGSELITRLYSDEETAPDQQGLLAALQAELLKVFPAAFLGRVNVVPYLPLQHSSLGQIVRLHLARIQERVTRQYQCELHYTDAVVEYVVAQCRVAETGARLLIRIIEQTITTLLGKAILAQQASLKNNVITLDRNDDEYVVTLKH
jgi:type VI secretion system protein VasG